MSSKNEKYIIEEYVVQKEIKYHSIVCHSKITKQFCVVCRSKNKKKSLYSMSFQKKKNVIVSYIIKNMINKS